MNAASCKQGAASVYALLVMMLCLFGLSACERGVHDMYQQPRYDPLQPSPLFANGNSAQAPPAGTLPASAGAIADTTSGRRGKVHPTLDPGPALPIAADGRAVTQSGGHQTFANPLPITSKLLARGRQRFQIYCAPCHGRDGAGDGMVVQRGFPAPPSYHSARLRHAADSHFYQVITHGYGVMYPYADRIDVHDRWAIVAYIRALQLSQHVPVSELSAHEIKAINAAALPLGAAP